MLHWPLVPPNLQSSAARDLEISGPKSSTVMKVVTESSVGISPAPRNQSIQATTWVAPISRKFDRCYASASEVGTSSVRLGRARGAGGFDFFLFPCKFSFPQPSKEAQDHA
jgi:hypothetical protein